MLLLSVMAGMTGKPAFIFSSLPWCSLSGRMEVMCAEAEGSVPPLPSGTPSRGLLPASAALKVKHKNGRSQRPKKNDILLVTPPPAPPPGPLLWGLLLLTGNRSRRLLCCGSVPHAHTHTHTLTRVHMLGWVQPSTST